MVLHISVGPPDLGGSIQYLVRMNVPEAPVDMVLMCVCLCARHLPPYGRTVFEGLPGQEGPLWSRHMVVGLGVLEMPHRT